MLQRKNESYTLRFVHRLWIFGFFFCFNCGGFELRLITVDELLREVRSYRGEKAVLVNIWATWCKPCVDEFPMIVNLENTEKDLKVIFVSADFIDNKKEVKKFLIQQNLKEDLFIKNQKDQKFIDGLHKDWTGALPFTILFGKTTGKVVDYWEGKRSKKEFLAAIRKTIK
ncbi:MAG: hypothetical protein CMG62_03660 [Candidatus Marinimicrobia bacterium]|nr:hypothetical protein [Candidatus Neomarinimicrobiota bacterium]